jgi:hypothetical protein
MRKKMAQRRPWFLWIGGACFLVGSLVAGSVSLASSATNGPTVSGTVTANQGTPGSSAWPVSASQSGSWDVGVSGSLPAGSNNIGHVNVDSLPPVEGVTRNLAASNGSTDIAAGGSITTTALDTSAYQSIRVYVLCLPTNPGDCNDVTAFVSAVVGEQNMLLDSFTQSDGATTTRVEEVPGTSTAIVIENNSADDVAVEYAVFGRTV